VFLTESDNVGLIEHRHQGSNDLVEPGRLPRETHLRRLWHGDGSDEHQGASKRYVSHSVFPPILCFMLSAPTWQQSRHYES
jgi:hypothetical protein